MQRASNFAEALVACNHPPPAKKIAKKRDLNTKIRVLAHLSIESGETQRQVAQKHGISERLVRRIKHIAKKSQEEHVDWYRMRIDDLLPSIDPHNMELDPPTTYTTNLKTETARIITADELNKHLIQGESEKSIKDYVRARIVNETSKDAFHGFFIVDDSGSTGSGSITLEEKQRDRLDRIVGEEVPKVLAKVKDYEKCFSPIFEYAQDAPLAAGEKRGSEDEELDKRMGDKKRMQAKLSFLMEVAATRLRDAKAQVGKMGAPNSKAGRSASRALKDAQKEDALFTELYNLLCANYERIRKLWPEPVRKGQDDAANYAIIRSFPKARSQGIHGDSEHRGFSILTAVGRQQYVVVVLNGFRAMRIYDKLVVDRAAATSLFRERFEALPGRRSFSETEWAKVEPRVWNALVHKEFEVQRLPPFEAVRVPISKGASIVLDTRCLHGGGPGDDLTGFRAHAYGTVRPSAPASSCKVALEKDYLTTVDILNKDYYPVGTWGARSGLWG